MNGKEQPPKPNEPPAAFKTFIDGLAEQKRKEDAALEQIPFKHQEIPAGLMREFRATWNQLKERITRPYPSIEEGILDLERFLDSKRNIFVFKFTTGEHGVFDDRDSIYYASPYGPAVRLKRIEAAKGLDGTNPPDFNGVLQLLQERIAFLDFADKKLSLEPQLEWSVEEQTSKKFYDAVTGDTPIEGDYVSEIKIYKHGEEVVKVVNPDGFLNHPGHAVNKIF